MGLKKILLSTVLLLFVANCFSQEVSKSNSSTKKKSWYVPDYASLQFAGNIGFLSTGIGYEIYDDVWYAELLYGFVPNSISESKAVHLITLKNTFPIFTKEIGKNLTISPITGLGVTYDAGTNSFTTLPSQFPKGYYVSNAIHFTVFGGAKIHQDFSTNKIFKGVDYYFEVGTIETYLWYFITSKQVTFGDAFSMAIGINFYF